MIEKIVLPKKPLKLFAPPLCNATLKKKVAHCKLQFNETNFLKRIFSAKTIGGNTVIATVSQDQSDA